MWTLNEQETNKPSRTEEEDESSIVETQSNKIFFYSGVTKDSVLQLNKQIADLSQKMQHDAITYDMPIPAIKLHINSGGGSLLDGFAAVDYIKNCKAPIHSIIDGSAASAATLMSVVAKKRFIHKHSFMLIHQLSGGAWGKYEDLVDDIKNSTLFMDTIYEIYTSNTKIPLKTLKEILKRDVWFDAKTCLKYGLVDEIL
jgi:ATP-dependent Clp endopeptidase proteolytic subunit ClpP